MDGNSMFYSFHRFFTCRQKQWIEKLKSAYFQFCRFVDPFLVSFSVCSHPVESYLFKRPNLQNWLNNRNLRVLHSHKVQPLPRHVVCIKIGVCVLWVKPSYMNDLKRNYSSEVVIFIGATYEVACYTTQHIHNNCCRFQNFPFKCFEIVSLALHMLIPRLMMRKAQIYRIQNLNIFRFCHTAPLPERG